jgi:hypothetical protein
MVVSQSLSQMASVTYVMEREKARRTKRGASPQREDLVVVPTVPVTGSDWFHMAVLFLFWVVVHVGPLSLGLYAALWIIRSAWWYRERVVLVGPRQ